MNDRAGQPEKRGNLLPSRRNARQNFLTKLTVCHRFFGSFAEQRNLAHFVARLLFLASNLALTVNVSRNYLR